MSKRFEVTRPGASEGVTEGLLATDWEITPSGALVFWDRDVEPRDFVIAYASGEWACFFGADD